MSDFDYGNARLRAMKSRMLSRRELEALTEAGTLNSLIAALTKTPYRQKIEVALTRCSGMDCIADALRHDLIDTLEKVRRFFDEDAGEMVAIVLRTYDVHNLKVVLRGLAKNASPGEILSSILPVGDLRYNVLGDLVRAPGPRGAIDLLVSMNLPYARPLLVLRAERPGADTFEMELALERWYYQEAQKYLRSERRDADALSSALGLDADLTNLLTVLRFAFAPEERKMLRERVGAEDLSRLFVGPGRLSFKLLESAGKQDAPNAAVEVLNGTYYEPALKAGLEAFARSGQLKDFEKRLRKLRLVWMNKLIAKDPLGIGVFLGYLALKINEISNIRWIAQGISINLKVDVIREELEFVA